MDAQIDDNEDGDDRGRRSMGQHSNRDDDYGTTTTTTKAEQALTARVLLVLCSLVAPKSGSSGNQDANHDHDVQVVQPLSRRDRLDLLKHWHDNQPKQLAELLFEGVDAKSGCYPLHWAAGTGFDEAVAFLLDHYENGDNNDKPLKNQCARKPSTGRTPLHYAARNGHLSTCQLLIQQYQADPNPKCHKGSVTPLQLAVWQNQLEIVQYLVQVNNKDNNNQDSNNVLLERNDFYCGLQHWIGLIPKKRWLSEDGSGVLPLAKYMHQQGLSYTSTPENQQNQGHTPLHKAAWGGNVALMEYFCHQHGVFDTLQDSSGNYAADLALMGGHHKAHEWLLQWGSWARQKSCQVLGVFVTATNEEIQARYKVLARKYHPDKLTAAAAAAAASDENHNDNPSSLLVNDNISNSDDAFIKIKAAYEHLIHHGGVGSQKNPKHEALRLLTAAQALKTDDPNSANGRIKNEKETQPQTTELDETDDLFHARLLAIISDYGDKGFPIASIARRWNQVWPDRPFPEDYIIQVPVVSKVNLSDLHEEAESTLLTSDGEQKTKAATAHLQTTLIPKRVRLLKFLKWKCGEVVIFRKIDGVELAFQRKSLPKEYKALTGNPPAC